MAGALSLGASDVHLEPEENGVRMRYRLDGVLVEVLDVRSRRPTRSSPRASNCLPGLKLNIKNAAQDGRFSIVVGGKEIEIRASVLPGAYAETIVMRVLDPTTIALPMEALGFDKYLMEIFNKEIAKPNGMILNTGPTGSGKTTTLYAFLRRVATAGDQGRHHRRPDRIPPERHRADAGLQRLHLRRRPALTLRQDPDVIMVGEIRDAEVASTAVQASLTGHLVFSTLHTNDAAGTFPRLIDMGVNADILGRRRHDRDGATPRATPVPALPAGRRRSQGEDRETMDLLLKNIPHADELPRTATRCGSRKAAKNAAASATRAASRSSKSSRWITR